MYIQHPILTEKHRIVDIFTEKLKYHMVLSIQTLCSVFSRSTLLIYYSHESFWERCNKFFAYGFGDPLPFPLADPLQFCQAGWSMLVDSHF